MKKRRLLLFLCSLLLFTGCSSYTELNDLGIISCLGIDYQDDHYLLYVNIIDGVKEEMTVERAISSFHGEGKTIEEAMEKIYLKSGKKLYLSHMNLLLLTDQAVQVKTEEILNSFLKNPESRNQFQIAYLNHLSLEELFDKEDLEKEITDLIANNELETGFTSSIDFESFVEDLLLDQTAFLPSISKKEQLQIDGTLFIEKNQPKRLLDEEESVLLSFLKNTITKTRIGGIPVFSNLTLLRSEKNKVIIEVQSSILEEHKKEFERILPEKLNAFLQDSIARGEDLGKFREFIRRNDYTYYQNNRRNLLERLTFDIHVHTTTLQSEIYRKEVFSREK